MKRKLFRFISCIDQRIFNGLIKKIYQKIRGYNKNDFWRGKESSIVKEPVIDMILMQYNAKDYLQYQFYDIAVRCLAIDQYYNKNDFGYDLYKKMHTLGGNYGQINLTEDYYSKARRKHRATRYGVVREEHSIEQFQNLIQSYDENGYIESSIIMADRSLISMNGSHRLALAIYNKQEFINVEVQKRDFRRRYSIDWFWKMGFSKSEIDMINSKMDSILDTCKNALGDYACILYPPAFQYFDDITRDIGEIDPSNIKVTEYRDYFVEKADFVGMVKSFYFFDSISPSNLERKLYYILQSSTIINDKLHFRIVWLHIDKPFYRLKKDNGLPESMATVRLKDAIRSRYKNKDEKFTRHYVGDFAHDVIIHSTDNYLSNRAVRYILEADRDISGLLEQLKEYKYALIETSADKISEKFPEIFYLNDDIDIFVYQNDLCTIADLTETYLKSKYNAPWFEVENMESKCGRRVKVFIHNCLFVMFDFMTILPGLKEDYIKSAIAGRTFDKYYHLSLNDELTIRLAKLEASRTKKWHEEFIRKNQEQFKFDANAYDDGEKMRKFFNNLFLS